MVDNLLHENKSDYIYQSPPVITTDDIMQQIKKSNIEHSEKKRGYNKYEKSLIKKL